MQQDKFTNNGYYKCVQQMTVADTWDPQFSPQVQVVQSTLAAVEAPDALRKWLHGHRRCSIIGPLIIQVFTLSQRFISSGVFFVVLSKMSSEDGNGKTFDVKNCSISNVVVYLDRAEVTREVPVKLEAGGNEVILKNLSRFIDQDSIRVEGKGTATITEVAYNEKAVAQESNESIQEQIKELHKKRDELSEKKEALQKEGERCQKQRDILDGLADKVKAPGPPNSKEDNSLSLLSDNSLKGLQAFLDMYGHQTSELDEKMFAIRREITKLDTELSAVYSNLGRIGCTTEDPLQRQVCIVLDSKEGGDVMLSVSYLVTRASWSPKYDLRVFSQDMNLKIMYYGMIEQSTGEDWNEAKLSLSTATPSVGGEVPSLGTEKVTFKKEIIHAPPPPRRLMMAVMRNEMAKSAPMAFGAPPEPEALKLAMDVAQAKVVSGVLSATFDIARPSTIPSDGTGHKVTVAIVDLKPTFEHVTIPKKSSRAFLKAKVKNDSQYVLLSGPTNVFLDNNFVAKARINSVSPSEEFDCSLGVDNAVRVVYKPQHKFHEQTGLITKMSCVTYAQEIEVKNTHVHPIKITVEEQLPLSVEDKIKVNLIEPQIPKEAAGGKDAAVSVNKQNNVVWKTEIPAGKSHEFVLRYSIEHPRGETIELTEEVAPEQF